MHPRRNSAKRLVAVVTPVVSWPPSADEEISMRHLRKHLGTFDRYVIGIPTLPRELADFRLRRFSPLYFQNRYAYNRLLLTREFYRAFADYEYILIYQLDCLVFANRLEEWCAKGWDYVGAPWLEDAQNPERGFVAVGNGGFSLRRVQSALAVLRSHRLVDDPEMLGRHAGRSQLLYESLRWAPGLQRAMVKTKTLLHRYGYHNRVGRLVRNLGNSQYHEDYFWAFQAAKFVEEFRIPAVPEALTFSFEVAPRYCFEANGQRLPFGCHAWSKYNREFWKPFLLLSEP